MYIFRLHLPNRGFDETVGDSGGAIVGSGASGGVIVGSIGITIVLHSEHKLSELVELGSCP